MVGYMRYVTTLEHLHQIEKKWSFPIDSDTVNEGEKNYSKFSFQSFFSNSFSQLKKYPKKGEQLITFPFPSRLHASGNLTGGSSRATQLHHTLTEHHLLPCLGSSGGLAMPGPPGVERASYTGRRIRASIITGRKLAKCYARGERGGERGEASCKLTVGLGTTTKKLCETDK